MTETPDIPKPTWCVMPVLAGPEMTEAAISDLLAQELPVRILVVNQGVDDAFRDRLERLAEQDPRIFVWHHMPPLLSLSATWNRALDYLFGVLGEDVALVVNNDVRLLPVTLECLYMALVQLDALFVSAVGVTAEQFAQAQAQLYPNVLDGHKGGPDFSCYLISADCHMRFRFDENFIPAFCEDLDYHRRLMLADEGSRIFSVNMPYLHLASQTLKGGYLPDSQVAQIRATIEAKSRAYYAKKWGGPVNYETFRIPFNQLGVAIVDGDPVTTPALQEALRGQERQPAASLGRATHAAQTAGSQGSGLVQVLPGDPGSVGDGELHVGGGDADGHVGDGPADPGRDAGDEPGAVEHPERTDIPARAWRRRE